jgi:hypothetical protein
MQTLPYGLSIGYEVSFRSAKGSVARPAPSTGNKSKILRVLPCS